jgi:hypothetical protein
LEKTVEKRVSQKLKSEIAKRRAEKQRAWGDIQVFHQVMRLISLDYGFKGEWTRHYLHNSKA